MIAEKLTRLGACSEAREWVARRKDPKRAWNECPNGSYLLWVCAKLGVDRKLLVLAACDCARLALKHTKDPRVLACIETTEAWCRGEATVEQVRAARDAAVAVAVVVVAVAAVDAAAAAADAAAAAVAADAAYAAYAAYAAGARSQARARTQKKCADLVRKRIPWSTVAPLWKAVK